MRSSIPDANHKIVIVDPLGQTRSVPKLSEQHREERNTVATATTARAISDVMSTRRPSCSRIPMRIVEEGLLMDLLPMLNRQKSSPSLTVSASLQLL